MSIPDKGSRLIRAVEAIQQAYTSRDKFPVFELWGELDAARLEALSSAIEPIEWQALLDALTFTAQNCGLVSDAHNSVVDKVEAMIRRSDGKDAKPEPIWPNFTKADYKK